MYISPIHTYIARNLLFLPNEQHSGSSSIKLADSTRHAHDKRRLRNTSFTTLHTRENYSATRHIVLFLLAHIYFRSRNVSTHKRNFNARALKKTSAGTSLFHSRKKKEKRQTSAFFLVSREREDDDVATACVTWWAPRAHDNGLLIRRRCVSLSSRARDYRRFPHAAAQPNELLYAREQRFINIGVTELGHK